ncbi:DNA oxidative demethylase AlkB [Idiomarina seosinensis]|uniref:DNA oxidative demethylase AlkB n=1 Tax=Idiomarina seosinensis TaxID=281739 RepID=UPI00384F7A8B
MQEDLFSPQHEPQQFSPCGYYLPGFIGSAAVALLDEIRDCIRQAPLRHFTTPGGRSMSVLSSNCGSRGWVSDRQGYRYQSVDPLTDAPWPAMPISVVKKAQQAARLCGFDGFNPDACLINVYRPGNAMGLHQDKDESDFSQPIVSFSFGLPVTFLWGGEKRADKATQITLSHGDALVWGGVDRLRFHGVKKLAKARHPLTGEVRVNLTLRKA